MERELPMKLTSPPQSKIAEAVVVSEPAPVVLIVVPFPFEVAALPMVMVCAPKAKVPPETTIDPPGANVQLPVFVIVPVLIITFPYTAPAVGAAFVMLEVMGVLTVFTGIQSALLTPIPPK